MARYREGGHRRKSKAEEPEIEARRKKPTSGCSQHQRAAAEHQKNSPAARSQEIEPSGSPQGTSENACGTSLQSLRRRRSQRSWRRVDRARGKSRGGGRGARLAKIAVEKASARHDPSGSWPGGSKSSIHLKVSASLSTILRAENDFMYTSAKIGALRAPFFSYWASSEDKVAHADPC